MDLGLKGRTALVTGASKGIGAAVADRLAAEGCHVHLAARTASDLEVVRDRIMAEHGIQAWSHPCDLSNGDNVRALAAACGALDILINNAGAIPGGTLDQIDETRWREAWDLKIFGYINLTRAVYADMSERGNGVVVNVVGLAGERYNAGYIAGSTGNAAMMAFTRTLGGVSLDKGVRVLGVNPGLTSTDRMTTLLRRRAENEHGDAERWQSYLSELPRGRAGTVEEVADTVAFFASDRASYISGVMLAIDGGMSSR